MDNVKTITALTKIINDHLISGDYPALEKLRGTRRDNNGDLLVDFYHLASKGAPVETITFKIQISRVR